MIGMTRSGKGETYVFPSIDIYSRAEKKSSMIIVDPKLELVKSSYETLQKRGYEIHILNLTDPRDSMGFNPLQLVIDAYKRKEYAEAELLCSSFCFSIFNPDAGGRRQPVLVQQLHRFVDRPDPCPCGGLPGGRSESQRSREEKIFGKAAGFPGNVPGRTGTYSPKLDSGHGKRIRPSGAGLCPFPGQ